MRGLVLWLAERRELLDYSVTATAEIERLNRELAACKELLRKERVQHAAAHARARRFAERLLDLEQFLSVVTPGESA